MKQEQRLTLKSITVAAYAAVTLLFILFTAYLFAFEGNQVYNAREISSYITVEDYAERVVDDASAPIGVRREFSWQIGELANNDSYLMFYIVHSYAEVYLDGERIYSLEPGEKNRIGHSPSSNWVVVPLFPSDSGRTVTVSVTPVYESVLHREVHFEIGSKYAVFMHRLKADLPQIVLASLCIFMGVLLIIVQLCLLIKKRTKSWDMLYLGSFSLFLGIWRIMDTRFSPIIFDKHTAALGYISLSALFLLAAPLLLYAERQYEGKRNVLLRLAALANCAVSFASLACQVFGIAELRETLTACHIMLIVDIAVLVFVSLFHAGKGAGTRNTVVFMILLATGSLSDLIYFYISGTSSGMMVTSVAFLIYSCYRFTENILNINKKAYVDVNTGLYNKARWNEYINGNIPDNEPIGIMMMDLNRLKHTNDTLGHKVGDRMIADFAEILRHTFRSGEFLCRWGGDEFTVVVRNADSEKMEGYVSAIHAAADAYNRSGAKPEIHFACGYALSADFPGISRNELLAKADERMYADKKQWYEKHATPK